MEIRPFAPADKLAVISLWDRCGLLRPWNDPEQDIQLKLTLQPEHFLVATEAGLIIGTAMAGFDGHRGTVYYLAVDPDHQSQGVGRAIMNEVERRLTEMGCPKLNILIRTSNLVVKEFYQKLGYQLDDVICMGKRTARARAGDPAG
jgi:ribosomal protein S18 acetylase RimI-like enzyme